MSFVQEHGVRSLVAMQSKRALGLQGTIVAPQSRIAQTNYIFGRGDEKREPQFRVAGSVVTIEWRRNLAAMH